MLFTCVQLCDTLDCSLPGSSVHWTIQARILGSSIPSSRGTSWFRDLTHILCPPLCRWILLPLSHQGSPTSYTLWFSHLVMSDSLQLHGLRHTRCPSPSWSPEVHPSSCPLHRWYQLAISSSDALFNSVQFSHSVMSDSLQPHGMQHARLPCPLPTPRAYSNSCPLHQWCHQTISYSAIPFSSCLQCIPASDSFPMSSFFKSGVQSIGVSALISVFSMIIQDWFF